MNLREELLVRHSKSITVKVAKYLVEHPKEISGYFKLFDPQHAVLCQRAAWPLNYAFLELNKLTAAEAKKLLALIKEDKYHTAVKRNVFKIFENVECPKECLGELIDLSFKAIENKSLPVAIRAYAIGAVQRYTKQFPELKQELLSLIELLIKEENSPAFCARGRRVIKALQ